MKRAKPAGPRRDGRPHKAKGKPEAAAAGAGWIACQDRLPDDDITVMIFMPGQSEPVWLGYHDGSYWYDVSSDLIAWEKVEVSHWMPLPRGPFDNDPDAP